MKKSCIRSTEYIAAFYIEVTLDTGPDGAYGRLHSFPLPLVKPADRGTECILSCVCLSLEESGPSLDAKTATWGAVLS